MAENTNSTILIGAAVAAVAVAAGIYFYKQRFGEPEPEPAAVTAPAPVPTAPNAIQHPLPQATPEDEPLPPLEQSDPSALTALKGTFGDAVLEFIVPENLIRNVVATVDNLPRRKLAARLNPIKPVAGEFAVRGNEEAPALDPGNYARYGRLLQVLQSTDTQTLVDSYIRFYPLLQTAYEDLGYPNAYFNDRVVEVIDHLLATPDVKDPIALSQPKVFYEFADPKLESLSAGQKALIRMGSAQAQTTKAKLQEIRARVAKKPPS